MGNTEVIEVSDDNILLGRIIDDNDLTVKQLAAWTGRGASTIYKYCSGDATIPSILWRVLYEKTGDERIVRLVTGDGPQVLVTLGAEPNPKKLDAPTLLQLIETRRDQIKCEELVLGILSDGAIDKNDKKLIAEYKKIFPEMVAHQSRVFQAITGAFELMKKG